MSEVEGGRKTRSVSHNGWRYKNMQKAIWQGYCLEQDL